MHSSCYVKLLAWLRREMWYKLDEFWVRISVYFYVFVTRLQRGKKQQIENGSGAEDNGDSSHCSNASTHSNQEAGPSNKRTKTSDDSGLELDNNNTAVAIDPVLDGASEIELVFRPHPTLMENDDSAQTRYVAFFFFVYSGLIPAVFIYDFLGLLKISLLWLNHLLFEHTHPSHCRSDRWYCSTSLCTVLP